MARDLGDFQSNLGRKPVTDMSDDECNAWTPQLPTHPRSAVTEDEFAASIARAREDAMAGRTYPHAIVGQWLSTWGKPGRKPFKEWLADRHV